MTGARRWGMPLYTQSSTRFGSTIIIRSSAGELRRRSDIKKPFIPTDLPEPVWPAMSRCGISFISHTMGSPAIPDQTHIASFDVCFVNAPLSTISRRLTTSRRSFGTSIPTRPRPGIGAWIRIFFALSASVRSFLSASILLSFTPSLGLRRY